MGTALLLWAVLALVDHTSLLPGSFRLQAAWQLCSAGVSWSVCERCC
jgi:hypothetical protein